jgi:hypothetical protein
LLEFHSNWKAGGSVERFFVLDRPQAPLAYPYFMGKLFLRRRPIALTAQFFDLLSIELNLPQGIPPSGPCSAHHTGDDRHCTGTRPACERPFSDAWFAVASGSPRPVGLTGQLTPRFAPPWIVEAMDACFIVRDHSGQALAL